jgi:iron(III) transport system substrate-binding protein
MIAVSQNAAVRRAGLVIFVLAAAQAQPASAAQDQVVNLYSARHYDTDEALYTNFTKATGIEINRIEAGDDALLERIRNEAGNSPADVLLIVDAARLARAEQLGLFAPVRSKVLEQRVPPEFRDPDGMWFGFSSRARVMVYDKAAVKAEDMPSYESLADPKNKGKVCTRPGSHPYMLALVSAMIAHHGEQKAEEWARGVVANFARPPQAGDTDQIRAVAAGECGIALTNSYYLVRLMRSDRPEDRAVAQKVGLVWPDQKGYGTHMNISGAGVMRNAPNRENAVRFLEYLASDAAQAYFAGGNNEWPVVKTAVFKNSELASLGKFKADPLGAAQLAKNLAAAQRIVDRVGWK